MVGRRAFQRVAASSLLARNRIFLRRVVLMLGGGVSVAAVLLMASRRDGPYNTSATYTRPPSGTVTASCERSGSTSSISLPAATPDVCKNVRTRTTPADFYFAKHGTIPKPSIVHAILDSSSKDETHEKNILVIGDVHGCFEELKLLHKAALKENGDLPFRYVILVGDLCNKGPDSAKVIRFVREQPNWYTVRGNNDNAALKVALGDPSMQKKKKYKWVKEGEMGLPTTDRVTLSDEDVSWMSELPYTITIPRSLLKLDSNSNEDLIDTIIVHAGLVPGQALENQKIETMLTIKKVDQIFCDDEASAGKPSYAPHGTLKELENGVRGDPVPWASVWTGPQQIIFGHDAKRGLQSYESNWATGLDTGAVYGKQLSGIILPNRRLIQVDSLKTHSPVG